MSALEVWVGSDHLAGRLSHDAGANLFSFAYEPAWQAHPRGHPLSPCLPFAPAASQTPELHSAQVRNFFENLLPEGEALDHAAQAHRISKSSLVGLLAALGRETAGALRVCLPGSASATTQGLREIGHEELSQRIAARAELPFSVWDGKVRLSIAGFQDKIAVYARAGRTYLVEGGQLASTFIVKPAPTRPRLSSVPANEHLCMALARAAGIPAAETRLALVPQPVLLVRRFDRVDAGERVHRLHLVDGCQALGLAPMMKYERPLGDGRDVQHIRDGASYPQLFQLLAAGAQPAADRLALLRWAIFQVLIGNTDAHAKNLSFFYDARGLRMALAYDLICMPALGQEHLADSFAMGIGDAFHYGELTPYEWAHFAKLCGLPPKLVARELARLAERLPDLLGPVAQEGRRAGVPKACADAVADWVASACRRMQAMPKKIAAIHPDSVAVAAPA